MKKVCTRWVPKFFTALQHINRVDCYEQLPENCNQDSTGIFGRIATEVETLICYYHSLNQYEAKTWKKSGEKTPTRLHESHDPLTRSSSEIVKVFFSSVFSHIGLQSIVHITHHSFTGYVFLFGTNVAGNLGVVCCFFTTTHLFISSISHGLYRIESFCIFSRY